MKKHHAANAHKDGHHHHKNEMAHHKMRDAHKAKHHEHKKEMHHVHKHAAMHEHGMEPKHLVGGSVADNHQQGIARKIQRPGAMEVGQHGSMADGWRHDRREE